jgi:hypothetical protein
MLTNVPLDQIVRNLITGSGSTLRNPEANYYQVTTDTLKISENTAQVFMGMRIQCAQCHNHPFDRWTMNDYYSFASFFPQVGRKQGEDPREYIVYDRGDGEVKHPVTGKPLPPKFLGAGQPGKHFLGAFSWARNHRSGGRRSHQQSGVEPRIARGPGREAHGISLRF